VKTLVVVESPAKAKTINRILGRDYVVKASMGHVRDLPEKKLGVDLAHGFEPEYVPIASRAKTLKELCAAAEKADCILLAPDPDREGEAIAWHLRAAMAKSPADYPKFHRITYNEITASAIRNAIAHPGEIDLRRVDSQQARRILDRVVGYKVSPLLWRNVRGAASAGRVQSVALRLLCEREKAIRDFVPEPYWVVAVRAAKRATPAAPFLLRLWKLDGAPASRLRDEARAKALSDALAPCSLRVADLSVRESVRRAPPPFITSTLQQAASSAFGMSASRTMKVAQTLYEGIELGAEGHVGLITYMRTDSVNIAREAQDAARGLIPSLYGPEYLPETPNRFKSRANAQEAHEAIRPTSPARTPDSLRGILSGDELRLYALVWRRFMASQMAPARLAQRQALVEPLDPSGATLPGSPLFRASATDILFPGWMKAAEIRRPRREAAPDAPDGADDEDADIDELPPLAVGEPLDPVEWLRDRKETQPPARYTEAALVKALEENGVGRPSTYAQIITTLLGRKYAVREKRTLVPTPLGMDATDFLLKALAPLFDVQFTAGMEEKLDKIEEGSLSWRDMMQDFYDRLRQWLAQARGPDASRESVKAVLDAFSHVTAWRPPVTIGKRVYSDKKFVDSVRAQYADGDRPVSPRQFDALQRIAAGYLAQIPPEARAAAGLAEPDAPGTAAPAPEAALDGARRRLALLEGVAFAPPRKVGKRTFDDAVFTQSLRQQIAAGRPLTEAQDKLLVRIIHRYLPSIPDGPARVAALGIDAPADAPSVPREQIEAVLALFANVAWNPPQERRGRTWDDHDFYDSIRTQYAETRHLTPRQIQAIKRLASAYAAQIPDYAAKATALSLPPPRAPRPPADPSKPASPRKSSRRPKKT
jgi:DNA topoisomerase-1